MQLGRRCEKCGQMIPWGERECPACGENVRFFWSAPRNELLLISVLLLVIVFVVTSFAVKAYRTKEQALGQQWYAAGERELTSGHGKAALEDFRSALVYSPDDSRVELELARALAAAGRRSEAQVYLISLQENDPGNGMVNLELARLAADSGSVAEAVHYYQNSIYGQWDGNAGRHRRQARVELAEFLLSVGRKPEAQAELMALTADLPSDPGLAIQAGRLLLKTGEYENASLLFRQALRLHTNDAQALQGLGEASFESGNYREARRYLTNAKRQGPLSTQLQSLLDSANLILEIDPLAPRLSAQERVRRSLWAFTQSMSRLRGCAEARGSSAENGPTSPELEDVNERASALEPKVRQRNLARDADLLLQVTDMAFEIEKVTERVCGEPQGTDLALLLLSRAQGRNE
jgi:tetratricopeptide (TPR) repeat protein